MRWFWWLTRRELAVDAALGLLVLVLICAAINAELEAGSRHPDLLAYAFAAVIGGLMLLRRRWPAVVLLGTVVLLTGYYVQGYPAIGLAVPLAGALYSAAEFGRSRLAIGTAVLSLVFSAGFRLLVENGDPAYLFGYDLPVNSGLMAAMIALGDSVRSRRGWRSEMDSRLAEAEAQREQQTARRIEQERLRIARDLHDVLTHTISVISLHSDVARESLRDDPDAAETSLRAVRTASGDAVRELRSTLELLRMPETEDSGRGPVGGVQQLDPVIQAVTDAGLRVEVNTSGEPVPLPTSVDSTAHRIVQEALTNVLRHAGAGQVTVELHYGTTALTVRVRDDGHGAVADGQGGGWGIVGMRERAHLIGGRLSAAGTGEGFVVEAELPFAGRT